MYFGSLEDFRALLRAIVLVVWSVECCGIPYQLRHGCIRFFSEKEEKILMERCCCFLGKCGMEYAFHASFLDVYN